MLISEISQEGTGNFNQHLTRYNGKEQVAGQAPLYILMAMVGTGRLFSDSPYRLPCHYTELPRLACFLPPTCSEDNGKADYLHRGSGSHSEVKGLVCGTSQGEPELCST